MIKCSKCGHENALGHIFCVKCRSKLDIQVVANPAWHEPKSKTKGLRGSKRVLLLIFVIIIGGVALALWPEPMRSRGEISADAQQARKKIMLLEKNLSPTAQVFSEREINAYLRELLRELSPPRTTGLHSMALQAVGVVIHPKAVSVSMTSAWEPLTIGSFKLGIGNITTQVLLVPARGPRGVQWTVKSGKIGHLPLPGPFSALAASSLRPLLPVTVRERALLAALTQLELEEGQVTVATKRARPSP
ncbi:MAG: zinc ribbon domain-containing protein [Lentisphaerae bacterium]|nr:zinc ribbon domain-containing protein [Lentisphaerota bacterium]